MTSPEKPKAKWGDLFALGVGAGAIAYFTRVPPSDGLSSETWYDAAIVVVPLLIGLGVATYLVYRLLGFIGDRFRRLLAGKR